MYMYIDMCCAWRHALAHDATRQSTTYIFKYMYIHI